MIRTILSRLAVFFTTSLVVTTLTTKLRASQVRFRTFVDHASDAFLLLDDDWTVLDVNRQAWELPRRVGVALLAVIRSSPMRSRQACGMSGSSMLC